MVINAEPRQVFHYFEEICRIPHASYHVDAISDYLMDFAKEHGLYAVQDEWKNVIIIKEAAEGKESVAPIMIQGHMDMVAVKEEDCDIDLLKDPLRLACDGDYIFAEGTSLGADDGIAVAYGLALLADDSLKLPRIELVITTQEEVGMEGATGIDLSVCRADRMLNIDSEKESEFVAACAGGISVHAHMPIRWVRDNAADYDIQHVQPAQGEIREKRYYQLCLRGFTGGHSGTEIICHRANADKIMGLLLCTLQEKVNYRLFSLNGGLKDNAIPVSAEAVIGISDTDEADLKTLIEEIFHKIMIPYRDTDCGAEVLVRNMEKHELTDNAETERAEDISADGMCDSMDNKEVLLNFLCNMPDGVQKMSDSLEGLVQTSLNLGIMETKKDEMHFVFSLRSSVAKEKEELCEAVCNRIRDCGGSFELKGDYPAWEYRENSALREHLIAVYEKHFHKKPEVLSIHAGLECGILAAKRPGLDCVSFGPDILDIHTTRERLSISSVQRIWAFLLEVLSTLE